VVWTQYGCRSSQVCFLFGVSLQTKGSRTLANSFSSCGLAVATATDSIIFRSEVYAASNLSPNGWTEYPNSGAAQRSSRRTRWGDKAVLVLVGLRLGLDGVHPSYYDTIKVSLTHLTRSLWLMSADSLYIPSICRYSRRPTFVIILLCRIAG